MLSAFLAKVADPQAGGVSPGLIGRVLKMSVSDMSRLTRLHRNTLTRTPQSPLVQDRVGEVARILAAAADLVGDEGKAAVWFRHQPLAGFSGRTAEELVAAGHAEAVLKHLDQLADGGFV